jgi:broad specificity phosphatase PhoE
MSLNLYLLRHGETIYSRSGGHCGWIDPDLTTEGEQMATAFAHTYGQITWNAIYASPMKRTLATAQPICSSAGMELQVRAGLKEIHYGDWEGKTVAEVQAQYRADYSQWQAEPAWNAPTHGETGLQVANRALAVVAEITHQYPSGNVLVVSHKATIRIILCNLLGIELGRYRDRLDVPACSVSMVTMGQGGPMLKSLGDRHHLNERLRNLPGT